MTVKSAPYPYLTRRYIDEIVNRFGQINAKDVSITYGDGHSLD